MTQPEFDQRLAQVKGASWREDFERLLHSLYLECSPQRAADLREGLRNGTLKCTVPWRNPTDYDRDDLTLQERMWHGLISHSLRDIDTDERQDLCSLAVSYHQAKVVGLDPDAVFKAVARVSSPAMGALLHSFLSHPDKSLHAWSLKIIQTPKGPWIAV